MHYEVFMKKFTYICILLLISLVVFGLVLNFNQKDTIQNSDYLRVHIRANSNSEADQNIKYLIKDRMIEFLTPKIADCDTKQKVVDTIVNCKQELTELANSVLNENGFEYSANIKISTEFFPTRTYEGYTLESGVYDAIVVELGLAEGNNWWCVMYPPLCFVDYSENYSQNFVYKSKIWEIIKQFFN